MNVIPPIPLNNEYSGVLATTATAESKRNNNARSSQFNIEDMTPPMQGQQAPFTPPVNEPRLVAVATDAARGATDRQIARIDNELESLTKRIKEIEKTLETPETPAAPKTQQTKELTSDDVKNDVLTSRQVLPTFAAESAVALASAAAPGGTFAFAAEQTTKAIDVPPVVNPGVEPSVAKQITPPTAAPATDNSPRIIERDLTGALNADIANYYTAAQVIDQIENRRGGTPVKGSGSDAFEFNSQAVEVDGVGTPGVFKTLVLRGYRNEGGWDTQPDPATGQIANPPDWVALTLEEEFENIDNLTMLREEAEEEQNQYCLQATWDYVRAYARPEPA